MNRNDDFSSRRDWRRAEPEPDRESAYGQREPYRRSRWDSQESSRYSESQFGQRRTPSTGSRDDYDSSRYRDDDSRSGRRFGSGDFGFEGGRRGEPEFGDNGESPRYFGAGNYSEGGTHYTGGYDQQGAERYRETERSQSNDLRYGYEGERGRRPQRQGLFSRSYKSGPKGYQRSDERLREDISERLMRAHDVDSSEVTVNVSAGKVTLEGSVPSRYMKHYIEDLADACPGVQDIDNRIKVQR